MSQPLPATTIYRLPAHWETPSAPFAWPWTEIAALSPFILADNSAPAR